MFVVYKRWCLYDIWELTALNELKKRMFMTMCVTHCNDNVNNRTSDNSITSTWQQSHFRNAWEYIGKAAHRQEHLRQGTVLDWTVHATNTPRQATIHTDRSFCHPFKCRCRNSWCFFMKIPRPSILKPNWPQVQLQYSLHQIVLKVK